MEWWTLSSYCAFILRQLVSPRKTFHSKMCNGAVHWLVRRIESLLLIIGPCRDTCREFFMHRNDWWLLLAGRCETRLLLTSRTNTSEHTVAQLVEALRYKPEGRGFDSRWCHWILSLTSFRPHYDPGVDSASNRNEYQEYFLDGEGGWCVGLTTLPPSYADCLEIWDPQPPGTLNACLRPVMGLLKKTNMCFSGRPSVASGCSRKASFLGLGRNTGSTGCLYFFNDARRSYITVRSVRSHYSLPASPCTRFKKEVPFVHVPQETEVVSYNLLMSWVVLKWTGCVIRAKF